MDLYFEYSKNITYAFLIFSFIWLNLSLILNNKFLIINRFIKSKYVSFSFRVFLIFIVGATIDESTAIKTLNLYTNWQIYAIFITTIFLVCMPGFLFLIIKKYL